MPTELKPGDKKNRLTFLEELPSQRKHKMGLFQCECGTKKAIRLCSFKNGSVKSCGCLHRETVSKISRKHGMTGSREYHSWDSMMQRCNNINNKRYEDYGGRGIFVCDRWREFSAFYEDMGPRPKGTTLDRIDNSSGYCPENCRWSTLSEQQSNQRKRRGSASKFVGVSKRPSGRWTAHITKNGKTKYLGDYATEEEASAAYQSAKSQLGSSINNGEVRDVCTHSTGSDLR
ncbi:AP2 domain [Enterobacter hormaechei]|uniref:AP2 domain-containing protein n=1 Tax=Enterobacter cloacae complex TaxID=354276 RepID=UPI000799666E|nr:AP2 domain-containing protein [Enterobacter hormaechei]DAH96767.1 MAG TPA: homing endonuclease [Caudoviricetes sp.]HCJ7383517.1 hypothetical protein [Enterobacter hormaechei subsp. xiangfangensis]HDS5134099.1 hypothetical protein [Enterobacter hormaechei subsp. oharae]EKX8280875.1 hypothetical protein [Enterobacter hormaechei]